jgi:class 3 adenylate cyclase
VSANKPQRSADKAPSVDAATTSSTPSAYPEDRAERRQVTVMFCDVVGSTSISAGLDAEDWRDLVGAYLDAASAAVTEMGGHVAEKLGDGLITAIRFGNTNSAFGSELPGSRFAITANVCTLFERRPHQCATRSSTPRHEIAVEHVTAVPRALWGFGRGRWLNEFGLKRLVRSLCR